MLTSAETEKSSESSQGVVKNDRIVTVSESWLEWLAASGRRPATVACRRESIRRLTEFMDSVGKDRCRDLTRKDIEQWRKRMLETGNAVATVAQRLRTARQLFNWLDEQGCLFENPTANLQLPRKPGRLPVVPTVGEVFRVLSEVDTSTPVGIRDRAIIETAYGGGLRLGEITALTANSFDWDFGLLLVDGKGGKQRSVPIGRRAVKWARSYIVNARPVLLGDHADPGPLWLGQGGTPLSSQGISVRIRHWLREAGLPKKYTPHALRRAAATHMLDNGASPFAVKEFLGHADMRHLSRYLRVTIGSLKRMHQASRLGE